MHLGGVGGAYLGIGAPFFQIFNGAFTTFYSPAGSLQKLQSLAYELCSETQVDEPHGRAHDARHLPINPFKVHNSKFNIHSNVARIEPLSQSYLRKALN